MSELYNRIENLCKEKGISVTQLCREAKINRSTLTELKKERTKTLSYTVSKKIADYFKIPLNEVYDGEEPKRFSPIQLFAHSNEQLQEAIKNITLNVNEEKYNIPKNVDNSQVIFSKYEIIAYFERLNEIGRKKALEYIIDLSEQEKYTK